MMIAQHLILLAFLIILYNDAAELLLPIFSPLLANFFPFFPILAKTQIIGQTT